MTSKSLLVRKYTIFIVVFLIIIVVALILGRGGSTETVKIGVIVPLSGEAQQFGQDLQSIFDYQLEDVNENAEANKVQFELVYRDGQCDTEPAATAYKEVVEDESIQFILGGACSNETLAIAPLAEDDSVLVVSPTSSASRIASYDKYVFSLSYPNTALADELARELSGYERIALLSEDKDYTTDIRTLVNQKLQEGGSAQNIVFDKSFSADATASEYQALLQELADQEPNVIFLNPNVGETAIQLVEQMKNIEDLSSVQLYGQVAFVGDNVVQAAPDLLEGMIIFDQPHINSDSLQTTIQEIKADQETELTELNDYYVAATLDSIDMLTGSILETLTDDNKQADATKVRDALKRSTYNGYLEQDISFSENNIVNLGIGKYHITNRQVEPLITN